ncbi:hypothetical protein I4U23_028862 [Adineta vaga]|nr:hypothetical protein I4U23_028862 [Adineta vaga]
MDDRQTPSLAQIHIAASHLRSVSVPVTPVLTNVILNKLTGRNIFLKCENLQLTGSVKLRGALNAILNAMKIEPNLKGFVSFSSGNHGIGVAYAASLVKRPSVIVVCNDTEQYKIDAIKQYGGEVVTCEVGPLNRIAMCSQISKERDYFIIPTADHPDVIAGQGSIAVELLEQVPNLDAILVPVSSGSLISGIALYAKYINPKIRIYACVPDGKMLEECLFESKRLWPEPPRFLDTKCEACRSQQCGMLTFPIMCSFIEKQVFTVSDQVMIDGTQFAFEHLKLVTEMSAGLSLGALLSQYKTFDANLHNIAVIISGGNVDPNDSLIWHQKQ